MFVWEYDHPLVHTSKCTDPSATRDYSDVEQLPSFVSVYSSIRVLRRGHQGSMAVELSAEFRVGVPSSVFFSIVHIYCEIVHTMVPAVRVTSHVGRLRGEYLGP